MEQGICNSNYCTFFTADCINSIAEVVEIDDG